MTEEQKYFWANFSDNPELLCFLADDCLSGIWFRDLTQTGAARLSAGFWLTLGYQADDIPIDSLAWRPLTQPDDLTLLDADMARHCHEPQFPIDRIVRYRHLDGSTVWMRCRGIAIRDSDGRVLGLAGAHIDLTDVKGKETLYDTFVPEDPSIQEQVDARFRYEAILRGTNVGTWEWNVQSGETRFNERWAEIIGYTLEELAPITIETWIRYAHPEDLARSNAALQACFEGNAEFYEVEARMRHRDGHWVWVLDRGKVFSWSSDGKPLMMYGTHQDISDRKRREEQLRQSEEAFRNNFHHAGIGMALVGLQGEWLVVNRRLCEFLGYCEDELLRLTFQDITHPGDLDKDLALLQEVIDRHREHYQIEKRYLHKAGHVVHALLSVSVVRNEDGSVRNFISQVVDITAQRKAQDHVVSLLTLANKQNRELQSLKQQLEVANLALREESLTDPLTGLPNRRVMDKALDEAISRVKRDAPRTLTLAMIDVDSFKSFNDIYGHPAGDDLLRLLGKVLISAIRPYDCVARIGGEEFAILLADTTIGEAFSIIERLRSTVEQTSWPHRAITISAGLYSWREGMSKEAFVEAADQQLYAAKRGGRNCVIANAVSRDQ